MSGQYKPFNYYGDDTKLQGFDVEICGEIAKRLKLEANPVTGPFDTLIAGVQAGRYDAAIASMARTPEREQQADFSDPYYVTGARLFVRPDSSIKELSDLKDANVGVALGTTYEAFARTQPNIKTVTNYKSDLEALTDLAAGRVDAVITDDLMGAYIIKEGKVAVQSVGAVLSPDTVAIPIKKGNEAMVKQVNQALADMQKDGTYKNLSEKWFAMDISQSVSNAS